MSSPKHDTPDQPSKNVEQLLDRLKYLLGGRLPEEITQPAPEPQSGSTTKIDASPPKAIVEAKPDKDDSLRAPLLYPPMTEDEPPASLIAPPVRTPARVTSAQLSTADAGLRYCPMQAIIKFPYKFVRQQFKQPLATMFFDAGKIWQREWDLFYIWSEDAPTNEPLILITEQQFLVLLAEMNQAFADLKWEMTAENERTGLLVTFPRVKDGLGPMPLGKSSSREQHDTLVHGVKHMTKSSITDAGVLSAFKDVVDLAASAGKKSKSKGHSTRQAVPTARTQHSLAQLANAKNFLGVHESAEHNGGATQFEADCVLVAIDCEAYERDSTKVTEIGIATLDTRSLLNIAPGALGQDWRSLITAKHYRIREYKHLVNKDFIVGRPDKFDFGQSQLVSTKEMTVILDKLFKGEHFLSSTDGDAVSTPRKIVLVGHDTMNDVGYCSRLGCSIAGYANVVDVLDTQSIFKAYASEMDSRSLGSVLLHFDVTAWNLHNAGNDAVYTLWALLAMCLQPHMMRP